MSPHTLVVFPRYLAELTGVQTARIGARRIWAESSHGGHVYTIRRKDIPEEAITGGNQLAWAIANYLHRSA